MIKNHCVRCGKQFNNYQKHYELFGNYCTPCCGIIAAQVEIKKGNKKTDRYHRAIKILNKYA